MLRKRLALAASLVLVLGVALGGCFKNPSDPITSGGSGNVTVNTGDNQTTSISTTAMQADDHGIYLSTVNQNGTALPSSYFRGGNFQVSYNGQTIPSGSITLSTASSSGQSISTSLVLDYSGSMSSDISNLETAATTFVNNMQTADRGEIIKFSDYAVVEQAYTSDKNALRAAITRATSISGGVTAFWDATDQGITDTNPESGLRAVVAFTDGYENNSTRVTSQAQLISNARAAGVPVFTIGLGGADETGLRAIADQTGGRYYYAPDSAQLGTIYQQVAQAFSNTVIISWSSFTYVSGASVTITVTYACATGTYTATASITLP